MTITDYYNLEIDDIKAKINVIEAEQEKLKNEFIQHKKEFKEKKIREKINNETSSKKLVN